VAAFCQLLCFQRNDDDDDDDVVQNTDASSRCLSARLVKSTPTWQPKARKVKNGQNALECTIFQLKFQNFSGGNAPQIPCWRGSYGYGARHQTSPPRRFAPPVPRSGPRPSIVRLCPGMEKSKVGNPITVLYLVAQKLHNILYALVGCSEVVGCANSRI